MHPCGGKPAGPSLLTPILATNYVQNLSFPQIYSGKVIDGYNISKDSIVKKAISTFKPSQSSKSRARSTSSAVQNEAESKRNHVLRPVHTIQFQRSGKWFLKLHAGVQINCQG